MDLQLVAVLCWLNFTGYSSAWENCRNLLFFTHWGSSCCHLRHFRSLLQLQKTIFDWEVKIVLLHQFLQVIYGKVRHMNPLYHARCQKCQGVQELNYSRKFFPLSRFVCYCSMGKCRNCPGQISLCAGKYWPEFCVMFDTTAHILSREQQNPIHARHSRPSLWLTNSFVTMGEVIWAKLFKFMEKWQPHSLTKLGAAEQQNRSSLQNTSLFFGISSIFIFYFVITAIS